MHVSIIIPARDAAESIADTLAAVRAQTSPEWEAIVVDDGSADGTAEVVARIAAADERIRLVDGPATGVSAARNRGISLARYGCLLFLDADDLIESTHLERLTGALDLDPDAGAACCGWAYVTPEGERIREGRLKRGGDLFPVLGRKAVFPVHACVVRRSLVQAVGGFDPSLVTCEDWDLWQRIARLGTKFVTLDAVLALDRMRDGSASRKARQMLADALRVLDRGHGADPRVPDPAPDHACGLPRSLLPERRFLFASWAAGCLIGGGEDARPLLDMLDPAERPGLDPNVVAEILFDSATLAVFGAATHWPRIWPIAQPPLEAFLAALSARTPTPGLARRVLVVVERAILDHAADRLPLTIGTTHGVSLEVTEAFEAITVPAGVERLLCIVEAEGERLGTVEVPVCDGTVRADVLGDAVVASLAWPILGRFFARSVYPALFREPSMTARREALGIGDARPGGLDPRDVDLHNKIGWPVFLQELWGHLDWPDGRFYDPDAHDTSSGRLQAHDALVTIEVGHPLVDVELSGDVLRVIPTVGGTPLGLVTIPAAGGRVTGHQILVAITTSGGMELCRAVVREALIGRPMSEASSLRSRLGAGVPADVARLPIPPMPARLLPPARAGTVLARRRPARLGTSADRRAALPSEAGHSLVAAAAAAGEAVVQFSVPQGRPSPVVYAPDLLSLLGRGDDAHPAMGVSRADEAPNTEPPSHGPWRPRHHFETIFAADADPWKYTSEYEQTKYEQTLRLLPSRPIRRALELACAEGHFTAQLAPRVRQLLATDISQIALDRAAARCKGLHNVRFARLDLEADPLPSALDLIICSEVLYYLDGEEHLRAVAQRLARALAPGGYLIMAHANLVVDEPDRTGFDWGHPFGAKVIGDIFAATRPLALEREVRTSLYRIQRFRRRRRIDDLAERIVPPRARRHVPSLSPPTVENADHAPTLRPYAAASIRWGGGEPSRDPRQVETYSTDRLPILMYHHVATSRNASLDRYRIAPSAFEEQLRYLRDAGYSSVGLDSWYAAMIAKRPLPGRAVLITFDDGYLDFLTTAWPLLKYYGFTALVFLVADQIGKTNSWDATYDDEVPLLGWDQIRTLRDEGVEFGSHSASHLPFTMLSVGQMVQEAARSRAILTSGLGTTVRSFAYPYGDHDAIVRHLVGASGYEFGLTCEARLSSLRDDALALPRLEVSGSDTLATFVRKLAGETRS